MEYTVKILVSLIPVFVFLAVLVLLDSYKLVKLRSVVLVIVFGCGVAFIASYLNSWLAEEFAIQSFYYTRYVAPFIEEVLKAFFLVYLIKSQEIGFMVDAAIYGFGLGAGFAFIENIYYLQWVPDASLYVWIIRGFGTAIMHGGTTTTFGVISKVLSDRRASENFQLFLPGLAAAVVFHSFYNHFFLSPVTYTVILLTTLPIMMILVFNRSESSLKDWLGTGFDTDMELLDLITRGKVSETNVGKYLTSIKSKFPGEVVFDMICLLRIHLELSIRAKGILMMREAGLQSEADPEIKEKFNELHYLEKNIGKTAQLALSPFLRSSSRDLWQLHMLGKE